ncbi:MAG: family acetyltransferase [Bacteroidetes bacterium]|nr:family acetyltransferase [Bacteroidota bacterium]
MDITNVSAAYIIAEAFLHYPLMEYAFKGHTESQRLILLHRLFAKCVSAADIYGGVILTDDKLGAVIWLPGKSSQLNLIHEVRSGMALIPFQVGIKPTLRLMNHDAKAEGWVRKNAAESMGYIWNIGALPEARGKGYSRLLVDQSLDQMHNLGLTECWLKTEDPKNVTIYQKLGFTLMNEMVVKSSGITSWALKKDV